MINSLYIVTYSIYSNKTELHHDQQSIYSNKLNYIMINSLYIVTYSIYSNKTELHHNQQSIYSNNDYIPSSSLSRQLPYLFYPSMDGKGIPKILDCLTEDLQELLCVVHAKGFVTMPFQKTRGAMEQEGSNYKK